MAEKKPQKIKTQSDYISDSNTSEDKVSQNLHTSQEERLYGTVKRVSASDTGGIGSYHGAVQPYSRERTTKAAKDLETF